MQASSGSEGLTVIGLAVMASLTRVVLASLPGSSTLMAQSPWVTMPVSASPSITSTARTRWSRIFCRASTTKSSDFTATRFPGLDWRQRWTVGMAIERFLR